MTGRRVAVLSFLFLSVLPTPSVALTFYVSVEGNDSWSGKIKVPNTEKTDGPFASLEAARNTIRELKTNRSFPPEGVAVVLRQGRYFLPRTFVLSPEDSGTSGSPIVYRAEQGAEVRLVGGVRVTDWKPVEDPAVTERLAENARGKIRVADLFALGLEDFGDVRPGGMELFFDDEPMIRSRWPNEGFTHIAEVTDASPRISHGRRGSLVGKFFVEGNRIRRWIGEKDLWLHGYWFWDWSDSYEKVVRLDPETKLVSLAEPYHHYGYKKGARFAVLNALSEIDRPGEWHVDREAGKLYFWPPGSVEEGCAVVSVLDHLVTLRDVSHLRLESLVFEVTRKTPLLIQGGTAVEVAGCTIRNTGGSGISVSGREHTIRSCDIANTGTGGVGLDGGDRKTLTPGRITVENNLIHHYSRLKRTYSPAVGVRGVGNFVRHNRIHDAPHNAIQLGGNENVIEFNEIHHVCRETADVGAYYMGRDWTQRGNVIRYNFFHHIGGSGDLQKDAFRDAMAVYLDDWASGSTVFGNIVYKTGRAVLIGGGRDNTVENNIFVDCNIAVHVDSRGLGWAKSYFNGENHTLIERLEAMNYRHPPYSERYPELLTLYDDEPAVAKGNRILRNVAVGCGKWLELLDGLTEEIVEVQDNFTQGDPGFLDPENLDFRLREDSPVFKLGFRKIPMEEIGLYSDAYRSDPN